MHFSPREHLVMALTALTLALPSAAADAAAEPSRPVTSHTPTAEAPSTIGDPRVDVTVKYEKGGTTGVLASGDVLTNDDNYRVTFKPTRDGYVYVYQIDAAQRVDTIFPNTKYTAVTNPVSSKIVYSVPPEGRWLHLDQTRGSEDIIIVAADTPLDDPKAIALRVHTATARGAASPAPERVFAYRLTFEHR